MQSRSENTRDIFWQENRIWHIGRVPIHGYTVLAPMAGVTDLPFRSLCKEQGAGLICMEMVSAKAIAYKNKNTAALMETAAQERPVSMQIFGSEPELMGEVARSIEERPFDILDINMGCPVPKVVGNGEGSALLKDPALISRIVKSVSSSIRKPVTVKMRTGFEGCSVDPVEIARRIEEAGAAALAVHGRTREQYYSGRADWETIARIREAVRIPVIGNGDADSPEKARAMLEQTGCAAVMIGRACRGNPWIFHQTEEYLAAGRQIAPPSLQERRDTILRHARLQIGLSGEKAGMRQMRKHIAWYTAGLPHSAALRREANLVETYAQLEELLCRSYSGCE